MSANFKKDYVAYLAIVIFFMIVIVELFMAIYIPMHLRSESVWAEEVSRQQMIDRFDGVRGTLARFKSKNETAEGEAVVALKCMDSLAIYLRKYYTKMDMDQIKFLEKDLNAFNRILNHLQQKGAYSEKLKLDPGKFINKLRQQAETQVQSDGLQ
jgi:hypothetical protein